MCCAYCSPDAPILYTDMQMQREYPGAEFGMNMVEVGSAGLRRASVVEGLVLCCSPDVGNVTAPGCICCSTVINNLLVRGTTFFVPPSFPPLHPDRFALWLGMSVFLPHKPRVIVAVPLLATSFCG